MEKLSKLERETKRFQKIDEIEKKTHVVFDYIDSHIIDKCIESKGKAIASGIALFASITALGVGGAVGYYGVRTNVEKKYYKQNPIPTVAEQKYSEEDMYVVYNDTETHYCVRKPGKSLDGYIYLDINDGNFVSFGTTFKYRISSLRDYCAEQGIDNYDDVLDSMGIAKVTSSKTR